MYKTYQNNKYIRLNMIIHILSNKLWKTGEDGLCCSSSAIQTRPGPSSLLEERSKTPFVFVAFFVLSATPPKQGKRPRYIHFFFLKYYHHILPFVGVGGLVLQIFFFSQLTFPSEWRGVTFFPPQNGGV